MPRHAYTIRDLYFGHGQPLFAGLNLDIPQGLLTAIVGPNGSGKSTLLNIMTGQLKPQSGTVHLFGESTTGMSPRKMARNAALMPQFHEFSFPFTVRETVFMGRHPHIPRFAAPRASDFEQVEQAMAAMNIAQFALRRVTELSGGERQRTMLARTLAQDTPVLLLDEPTANQDISHSMRTLRTMRTLVREKGNTVVSVLHDLNHAAAFADHIVFLRQGSVHAAGPVSETLTTQNVHTVFDVDCQVRRDVFSESLAVFFRPESS